MVLSLVVVCSVSTAKPMVLLLANRSMVTSLPKDASFVLDQQAYQIATANSIQATQTSAVLNRLSRYAVADVSPQDVAALVESGAVVSASPLGMFSMHAEALTNDSLSHDQYALTNIGAKVAWTAATGKGIRVGILDTGIDWTHPDLAPRLAVNTAEDLNGNGTFEAWSYTQELDGRTGDLDGIDNDGNGYTDDVIGYDFVDQTIRNLGDDQARDAIPADEQGHGTSVAGVVAAQANNGIGIAGLAFDATIVTLRAFDATGNAEEDDIAAALVYAAVNNVSVVNMSFGDGVDSPVLRDAIAFASMSGCILVASAGNSGQVSRQYPAGYDQVIAVGSTNSKNQRSVFSSTGSLLTLTAPGEAIVTTAVGSKYRTVSGTSFSAPYVAATAALIREQQPSITHTQVEGILKETALDLGSKGWDGEYGAGLLQADAALRHPGMAEVRITSPHNEQECVITNETPLPVVGSAYALLFDKYEVLIGRGVEPQTWTLATNSAQTVVNGLLATVNANMLTQGDYVIRLVVHLKNGGWLESRRRIHVVTNNTLSIDTTELATAWNTDLRVGVLTLTTSRPTQITLIRTPEGGPTDTTRDDLRFTRKHCLTIPSDVWSSKGSITIIAQADNADTVHYTTSYDLGDRAMPLQGFNTTSNGDFQGYVLNDVRDILNDGKQAFVMSDLSNGSFGPLTIVQRNGFDFVKTQQTSDVWIPRGMGDANGNGRLEVFAHVVGKAILFEQLDVNSSPFGAVVFADTLNGNNAAAMADVNGDGREDLVVLSNTTCSVYSWQQNAWQLLGQAVNTTPPAPGNAENRVDEVSVAIGDFDGDGKAEIAYADTDGDMLIAEYTGTELVNAFVFESEGIGGSGYLAAGDVNNDGKPEILFGVPDDPYIGTDQEYGRQLWTYRVFSSLADNTYHEMWKDHVYGVRYGIGYRNGVELANADDVAGDEILICAFQRLFAFTWNDGKGVVPLYYTPDVVTPRFLTHDFNANGVNELGFGVTANEVGFMTNFSFVEYKGQTNTIATPCGVQAVLVTPDSVRVHWMNVDGAKAYCVFADTGRQGLVKALDTVITNSYELGGLKSGRSYDFRVSALPIDTSLKESNRSAIARVQTGPSGQVKQVTPTVVSQSNLEQGLHFTIRYSTVMPSTAPDAARFSLYKPDGSLAVIATSVSVAADSAVMVSFLPIADDATSFVLSSASFADKSGIPTESSRTLITVTTTPATKALVLSKLVVVSNEELHLSYSLPVDESALATSAYALTPFGAVIAVTRIDSVTVSIRLSSNPPMAATGTTFAITVRNVTGVSGIPITTGTGNTLGFVLTSTTLDRVFVFPHPCSITNDGGVTFANLTVEATVEVLDQRFRLVRTLNEADGNGGVAWDLRDKNGVVVPPGMYFYRVVGKNNDASNQESGLRKIMLRQ